MNLFLLLGAAGLSHSLFGKRLIPIGTVYDPFVARGLDALNYACYQDARFMIVGTPSGVTLAPEGGAHQSIGSPLIGMSQDGLAAFEPAFADELAVIMEWAFDYMQRDGEGDPDERTWLRDETGGSVYLGSPPTRSSSPASAADEDFRQGAIDGAYWLRKPGPNCEVVIAYQGSCAGSHRGRRPHRRDKARHRCAGRHLSRPAQRRLDRGTARPRPGQPLSQEPYRDADWGPAARMQACHRHRRPPRHACLDRLGARATRRFRSASSISARPARSATSTIGTSGMPPLMRHDG
jgi:pyruvate dehydrogenase E1 component